MSQSSSNNTLTKSPLALVPETIHNAVWPRIPFAAVNMTTAIAAIKANFGVVFFAFVFPILGIFWTVIWVVAFSGVQESVYDVNQGADQEVSANCEYYYIVKKSMLCVYPTFF
jgi:hypothetical protein